MGVDTSSAISGDRHAGVPVSGPNRESRDQFEYGSMTAQAAGRYKSFATAFSARPIVVITRLATAGSANVFLMGTPNVGSFRARTDQAGTQNVRFIAFGAR